MLRLAQNELAYPAGVAPGFDPSHIALRGAISAFSSVAQGGTHINLRTGARGGVGGSVTFGIDKDVGPSTITTAGGSALVSFVGNPTVAPPALTMAAIVKFSSGALSFYNCALAFGGTTNTSVWLIWPQTQPLTFWVNNATQIISTIGAVATGVPYFVIASGLSGGAVNFLIKNLATGKVLTETVAASAVYSAPNGNIRVAANGFSNSGFGGLVAASAAIVSNDRLSVHEMRAWADDPWSFWYPQKDQDLALSSIVSTSLYETKGGATPSQSVENSSLTYPFGTPPGLDPEHPATAKTVISVIASGANQVDLMTGLIGTPSQPSTSPVGMFMDGVIGPTATNPNKATVTFTKNAVAPPSVITMAGIYRPNLKAYGYSAHQIIRAGSSPNFQMSVGGGATPQYYFSGGYGAGFVIFGGMTAIDLAPQFWASSGVLSGTTWTVHSVLVRLDNGKIITSTDTFTNGNNNSATVATTFTTCYQTVDWIPLLYHAAAMMAHVKLSPEQLLTWAKDPWSFWYPRRALATPEEVAVLRSPPFVPNFTQANKVFAG